MLFLSGVLFDEFTVSCTATSAHGTDDAAGARDYS